MRDVLEGLLGGVDLTVEDADGLMVALTSGDLDPALAGAILAALRSKGETPEEVRGFASAMRRLSTDPGIDAAGAVDIVGTGGDRSGSLNLSTGAAIVTAAAGVPVVKHGNRSMTSSSGSADVLEALGVPIPLEAEDARRYYEAIGFTFLFAPHYHPAMAAVGPVRRSLGVRTVFNMLGPLSNPAAPRHLVIGAFGAEAAELMAGALSGMEVERAFVVHGAEGWDEPSPLGEFMLFDVRPGIVEATRRNPSDFGIPVCAPEELAGGDPGHNARRLTAVLDGEPGAHRDAIALGAALAFEVTGKAADLDEGLELAYATIDSGQGRSLATALGRLAR